MFPPLRGNPHRRHCRSCEWSPGKGDVCVSGLSGHGTSFSSLPLADLVPPVAEGEVLVDNREEGKENRNSRERAKKEGKKKERKERRKKGRKERAGGNDGRKREAGRGKRVSKH